MSNDCDVNPAFKHLPELPDRVKALVLKERVHLGSLGLTQRLEALSLVETDYAELRRWLVDTGLLERDGYGRVYNLVSLTELPADLQAMVIRLCDHDPKAIAKACIEARKAHAESRAARRALWVSNHDHG